MGVLRLLGIICLLLVVSCTGATTSGGPVGAAEFGTEGYGGGGGPQARLEEARRGLLRRHNVLMQRTSADSLCAPCESDTGRTACAKIQVADPALRTAARDFAWTMRNRINAYLEVTPEWKEDSLLQTVPIPLFRGTRPVAAVVTGNEDNRRVLFSEPAVLASSGEALRMVLYHELGHLDAYAGTVVLDDAIFPGTGASFRGEELLDMAAACVDTIIDLDEMNAVDSISIQGNSYTIATGCAGTVTGGLCSEPKEIHIDFTEPFYEPPQVHVSPANLSEQTEITQGTMDTVAAYVKEVTATGFTLVCSSSPNDISSTAGALKHLWASGACSWVAVGSRKTSKPISAVQVYSGYQLSPSSAAECSGAWESGYCHGGNFFKDIVFDRPFKTPPTIVVNTSFSSSFALEGYASDRIHAFASQVTETGARIWCSGSKLAPRGTPGEASATPATCDVMAVGESAAPDPASDIDPKALIVKVGSKKEATTCYGSLVSSTCTGGMYVDVTFDKPFATPPTIHVSPAQMGTDPTVGGTTDLVRATASGITTQGFRLWCSSSPLEGPLEGYVSRAACNWIAIGK